MLFRTVADPKVLIKAVESFELSWKTVEAAVTFQFAGFENCGMIAVVEKAALRELRTCLSLYRGGGLIPPKDRESFPA
jgi:hypothetical protein